jgi:hypothetical protein
MAGLRVTRRGGNTKYALNINAVLPLKNLDETLKYLDSGAKICKNREGYRQRYR